MKILWVFAHPEQRSLNGSLMAEGLRELTAAGHQTQVSDLYAMDFDPVLSGDDFLAEPAGERLRVGAAQKRGRATRTLSADILAEQGKAQWANAFVFHFPLWWFGPPAILKGWFDRVFVNGFAFGVRDRQGRTRRYGDGGLAGKRALTVTSVGAREVTFGPRGVHGHIDEVLFPLLHGTYWYTGIAALPPFVVYGADRLDEDGYTAYARQLRERLRELPDARTIPYRTEAGGDYDEELVLRADIAPGRTDLGVHRGTETPPEAPAARTERAYADSDSSVIEPVCTSPARS